MDPATAKSTSLKFLTPIPSLPSTVTLSNKVIPPVCPTLILTVSSVIISKPVVLQVPILNSLSSVGSITNS